jgi:toxin ParE1/3/4
MRVRFSPEAFADRKQIFEYLHAPSPDGARNVLASIRAAVAQLADQPYSGYQTDDPDVRAKFVIQYPYKITSTAFAKTW